MNKFLAITFNRASFEKRDALAFKQTKKKKSIIPIWYNA